MTQIINIPASLNAIGGQLPDYQAPNETVNAEKDYSLFYEILKWNKTHPDGMTENTQIGPVKVSRFSDGDQVRYQILERRLGGEQEVYEAEATTSRTGELGESIKSWSLDWHLDERPPDHLKLSGTVQGEMIEMDGTTGRKKISTVPPVLCPWIMPFVLALRGPNTETAAAFTSVDELTYCKSNQLLHGPDRIHSHNCDYLAFRHTGPATLPIHYVFDPQGRPVFVTFTMVSWILRSIDV